MPSRLHSTLITRLQERLGAEAPRLERIEFEAGYDHDGDEAIWVRLIFPDDHLMSITFEELWTLHQRVQDIARQEAWEGFVYVSFRGSEEDRALTEAAERG